MDNAFQYWTQTAHTKPEAQALAARLGLEILQGTMRRSQSGLMYPLRRLVISLEDTSAKMAVLLGPNWQTAADSHKQCRMYVLMSPPQGSPARIIGDAVDEGSARWTPRPPSIEEEEVLTWQ